MRSQLPAYLSDGQILLERSIFMVLADSDVPLDFATKILHFIARDISYIAVFGMYLAI